MQEVSEGVIEEGLKWLLKSEIREEELRKEVRKKLEGAWIAFEEIEKKLEEYREKRGIRCEVLDPDEFRKRFGKDLRGVYLVHDRKICLPQNIPNCSEGCTTKGFKIIKKEFPEEYEKLRNLLFTLYENPSMLSKRRAELWYSLLEIEENLLEKIRGKQDELFISKKRNDEVEKLRKIVIEELRKIREFIQTPIIEGRILCHITSEAHETGHAVFYHLIESVKSYCSTIPPISKSIREGFANSFVIYYLLKQAEKGYLSPSALLDAFYEAESSYKFPKRCIDKSVKKYIIGGLVFGLDGIGKELHEMYSPSILLPEEFKRKLSRLRRKVGSNIEYIIGIIINPGISPKEKKKILKELEEDAERRMKKLYNIE